MKSIRSYARQVLWPIYGIEHQKFLPLAFMMMCILFNYSLLRSVKDGFIVTSIGAEALGFLKTCFVLPSAIIATMIYTILCNHMDSKKVFYVFAGFFIGYFILFTYVLFPSIESYRISDATVQGWITAVPRLKWIFRILQNWTYASFYIISELWGSMMVSLFFWQLANEVTRPSEAKRFYSMFGFVGNFGLLLTGYVLTTFLKQDLEADAAQQGFMFVLSGLILSALVMVALYAWTQLVVATNPALVDTAAPGAPKKKKSKPGLAQSFKVILTSRYLGLLTILLVSYGISTILIEGVWKDRVKALYPTKEAYVAFMGGFQAYQGVAAILFMLIGTNILRLVNWTTAAILTPAMILVTGFFFFLFIFASKGDAAIMSFVAASDLLFWAVMIGAMQNILSKATKYSLFDSTQKMAYMPLDDELKTKGMSAVEVIGGRLGKSGGGFLLSLIFLIFPSYTFSEATPILAVLCGLILVMWIYAVKALGREYEAATKLAEERKAQAA